MFIEALLHGLVTSVNVQKELSKSVRKMSPKRKQPVNNISVDGWFDYFKALLEKYIDTDSGGLVRDQDKIMSSIVPFQKKKYHLL